MEIYREPASKVINVSGDLIVDKGKLIKAFTDSKGRYLFSEVGAGIKPLVIIGTLDEILDILLENRDKNITNEIEELPNIYFSISKYSPGERFTGVFPFGDAIVNSVHGLGTSFLPTTIITDTPSSIYTFYQNSIKPLLVGKLKKRKDSKKPDILYAKFSYFEEEGSINLGKKVVFFESAMYKILGFKETRV